MTMTGNESGYSATDRFGNKLNPAECLRIAMWRTEHDAKLAALRQAYADMTLERALASSAGLVNPHRYNVADIDACVNGGAGC